MNSAISTWWTAVLGAQGKNNDSLGEGFVSSVLPCDAWEVWAQQAVCLTLYICLSIQEAGKIFAVHASHSSPLCLSAGNGG